MYSQREKTLYSERAKKYYSMMVYQDSHSKKPREVKDLHDFPKSFLAHLERAWKENDWSLMKAYGVEHYGSFKKFSHKNYISWDLYYNVYCGDVLDMIHILAMKEYTLLIIDILKTCMRAEA